jgi:hypothetical protein
MLETTWQRKREGWVRGDWLVREADNSRPDAPNWELCKRGADGNLRALDEGPTARGMMDHADISDGL